MRKLPAIIGAAALLLSLAACSGQPGASSCKPVYPSGANSQLVEASGILGGDPAAKFPTPLVANGVQASSVITGDGQQVGTDQSAMMQVTIYDGKTGVGIAKTDYTSEGFVRTAGTDAPYFGNLAQCATVNSRVAAVGTAGDLLGAKFLSDNQFTADGTTPLAADDTVVIIADIKKAFLGRANGADQPAVAGMPAIVLAPNGQPGFTIPSSAPPTELKIATLKKGNGAAVEEGDEVVVNYAGILWPAGAAVFDSSWDRGYPSVLLAKSLSADPNGLAPGFAKALIGSTVGSQVLVVIPPADGYPAGSAPAAVPAGSTMVFVFDVLGIDK